MTVSLHGHGEPYVSVGGTAPVETRRQMAQELSETLPDADVRFRHDAGANMGTTGKNFVNWLREGATGVSNSSSHDGTGGTLSRKSSPESWLVYSRDSEDVRWAHPALLAGQIGQFDDPVAVQMAGHTG